MKVGFIGLGAMGSGMAANLANAHYLTVVYNRTINQAQQQAKRLKVESVNTPQELAALVDVIFICVSADSDVLDVVNAITETVRAGTVVIDCSTFSSDTAQQAAQLLAAKQADFLDAPVSGGVEGARNGTLAVMAGGDEKVFKRVLPVLQAIGRRIVHMGPVGSGQATKAVNQIMAAGINQAVTDALAFGQCHGLDMTKVIEVVSGGAAGNWFLEHRGPTMVEGVFRPGFKLALHHKDLMICQKMAEKIGWVPNGITQTLADYQKLMDQGLGESDISALYRLKFSQNIKNKILGDGDET